MTYFHLLKFLMDKSSFLYFLWTNLDAASIHFNTTWKIKLIKLEVFYYLECPLQNNYLLKYFQHSSYLIVMAYFLKNGKKTCILEQQVISPAHFYIILQPVIHYDMAHDGQQQKRHKKQAKGQALVYEAISIWFSHCMLTVHATVIRLVCKV